MPPQRLRGPIPLWRHTHLQPGALTHHDMPRAEAAAVDTRRARVTYRCAALYTIEWSSIHSRPPHCDRDATYPVCQVLTSESHALFV